MFGHREVTFAILPNHPKPSLKHFYFALESSLPKATISKNEVNQAIDRIIGGIAGTPMEDSKNKKLVYRIVKKYYIYYYIYYI